MLSKFQVIRHLINLPTTFLRREATYNSKPIRLMQKPKPYIKEEEAEESNKTNNKRGSWEKNAKKNSTETSPCRNVNMDALVMSWKDMKVFLCKVPVPNFIRRDEVSIKVKYCAITQTDIDVIEGSLGVGRVGGSDEGLIGGRELSGVVCGTGDAVRHVRAGDRVVVTPCHPLSLCKYCSSEKFESCIKENGGKQFGVTRNGGWASFTAVPGNMVYKVEGIEMEQAALLPLLAQVMCSLSQMNIKPQWHVLIQGCGLPGLLFALLLQQNGHQRVTIWEDNPNRIHLINQSNLNYPIISNGTISESIDLVISNGAGVQAMQQAYQAVNSHGQFIVFGNSGRNGASARLTISTSDLSRRGVTLRGITCGPVNPSNVPADLASRILKPSMLGVELLPLKAYEKAFTKFMTRDINGVIFRIH